MEKGGAHGLASKRLESEARHQMCVHQPDQLHQPYRIAQSHHVPFTASVYHWQRLWRGTFTSPWYYSHAQPSTEQRHEWRITGSLTGTYTPTHKLAPGSLWHAHKLSLMQVTHPRVQACTPEVDVQKCRNKAKWKLLETASRAGLMVWTHTHTHTNEYCWIFNPPFKKYWFSIKASTETDEQDSSFITPVVEAKPFTPEIHCATKTSWTDAVKDLL